MQPFDSDGRLLCFGCHQPIEAKQFWLEIRQRDDVDADARLAVHPGCLVLL
jgi:hypothetical protein